MDGGRPTASRERGECLRDRHHLYAIDVECRGSVQLQNIASAMSSAVIGVRPWLKRSFFSASPPKRTSIKSVSVRPGSILVTRTLEPRTSARRFNANCFTNALLAPYTLPVGNG